MPLQNWGAMEKAQDDAQTIDEAIAQAIADHNADPEAHNSEGGSLYNHTHEEVIDHPPGSLLADKQTFTEISAQTIFESLDGWGTTGDVINSDMPGIRLYVESGATDNSQLYSQPQTPVAFRNSTYSMLYQIIGRFDLPGTTWDANFGFFNAQSTTPEGFGFVVINAELFGYVKCGANTDITDELVIDLSTDHVYRAYYDSYTEQVTFTIDGQDVATLDLPAGGWEDDTGPGAWLGRGSASDGNFYIGMLAFARSLI